MATQWQQGAAPVDGVVDQFGNLVFPPPYPAPQQVPQAQQQQQMPQYVQIGPGGLIGTQPPMMDPRGYVAPGGLTETQQFMVMMRDQMQQFMTTMSTIANALGTNPAGPAMGQCEHHGRKTRKLWTWTR